jgi:hypothetical protein
MKARSNQLCSISASRFKPQSLLTWVPANRRLVLIDLENLVGGSDQELEQVVIALDHLKASLELTVNDIVVYASGSKLFNTAISVLPSNTLLGRGIDGADRRLLERLSPDDIIGRFASVALVSGDSAAFARPVQRLAAAGVPTDVYLGSGFIGADLYKAARSVVFTTPAPALSHV